MSALIINTTRAHDNKDDENTEKDLSYVNPDEDRSNHMAAF